MTWADLEDSSPSSSPLLYHTPTNSKIKLRDGTGMTGSGLFRRMILSGLVPGRRGIDNFE